MNRMPHGLPFTGSLSFDQDRHAPIDAERDLGVTARPEHRAGAGVGVEQGDLLRREGELHVLPGQVDRVVEEEREARSVLPVSTRPPASADRT